MNLSLLGSVIINEIGKLIGSVLFLLGILLTLIGMFLIYATQQPIGYICLISGVIFISLGISLFRTNSLGKLLLLSFIIISLISYSVSLMRLNIVSGTWRYKMTVAVETPEGIKTGYSVREFSNSATKFKLFDLPQTTNPVNNFKGEAVVVDLGERGKVFSLLRGHNGDVDYAKNILFRTLGGGTNAQGIEALNNMHDLKIELPLNKYPLLITFSDIDNPMTAEKLLEIECEGAGWEADPKCEIKRDRFEEFFGRGVKLKGILLETTKEPIKWEIENYLTWLNEYSTKRKYGIIPNDPSFANSLHTSAFRVIGND